MTNPLPGKIIPDIIPGRRRKRLHSITGKEALRLGFTSDRCAEIFHEASSDVKWKAGYWLNLYIKDENGETTHIEDINNYCIDCVKKKADVVEKSLKNQESSVSVMGWLDSYQTYPELRTTNLACPSCDAMLQHYLENDAIDRKLIFREVSPVCSYFGAVYANLITARDHLWNSDYEKLALFALATWWEREHGNWAENPLVTIVGPNQLTPGEREEAERLSAEFEADVARGVAKGLDPKGDG